MNLTKQIDWSYPTSENAKNLGWPHGCWTVSISTDGKPARAVAGFLDLQNAVNHARSLPMPFGYLWQKYELDLAWSEYELTA